MPRRSLRLQGLRAVSSEETEQPTISPSSSSDDLSKKRRRSAATTKKKKKNVVENKPQQEQQQKPTTTTSTVSSCLPRTVEQSILSKFSHVQHVIGIDEAGRGPLAGPVVAAAVWAPVDLQGIVDSKKITKEEDRERLFEELIKMDQIQWAVSIMDAQRIDEINILQATLEGMRMAATALVDPQLLKIPIRIETSVDHLGCYVVCSSKQEERVDSVVDPEASPYYALIDGNKIPKDMPCPSESMVKGDGKEFCIAAASVLAKVTRDRLMHGYDVMYPDYNLKQHKGYPTAAHMKAVFQFGASPIHRRTFAPLKHMEFDEDGKILKAQ